MKHPNKIVQTVLLSSILLSLSACGGGASSTGLVKTNNQSTNHPIFDRKVYSKSPSYSPSGDITETSPTFSWKAISNATEYHFGHENTFGDPEWHEYENITTTEANCGSATSIQSCTYTPTDISFSVGDEKVWWVRAKVAGSWNEWSQAHVFKIIKNTTPGGDIPKIVSPKGDIADKTPTFSWQPVATASKYYFGIENLNTPDGWLEYTISAAEANCQNGAQKCSYTPTDTNFVVGDQKEWWVRAETNDQWGEWSEGSIFSIINDGTSVERPFKINVKGYSRRIRSRPPRTVTIKKYTIKTVGSGYNYSVDCNSDGVMEATGLSGDYTCTYPDKNEYTISISGIFPQFRNSDGTSLRSVEQWGTQVWRSMDSAFQYGSTLYINTTDTPNLTQVNSLKKMFSGTGLIDTNSNLASWDVSKITNMSETFEATGIDLKISNWDTSNVTDMSGMFREAFFNQNDIANWNVSKVTNMSSMFTRAKFNQDIGSWDVSSVTDMSGMFADAKFNQDIGNWNVSKVKNMKFMFGWNKVFNQDIGNWNVGNVTDMEQMFNAASQFNQNLNNWDVSNVTSMKGMFVYHNNWNQPLGNWDVSKVTQMGSMFLDTKFDQDISNWNVSNVKKMSFMFAHTAYNQDISNWDVSNVTDMNSMFAYTTKFQQSINSWNVSKVTNMSGMFRDSKLQTTAYDSILNSWSALPLQSNVNFGVGKVKYSPAAAAARKKLVDTFGWKIKDGGLQ